MIMTDLVKILEELAPLESGEIHLSERKGSGLWRDVTQEWIARHRRATGTYEAILAAAKIGKLG